MNGKSKMSSESVRSHAREEVSRSNAAPISDAFIPLLILTIWFALAVLMSRDGVWARLPRMVFPASVFLGILIPFLAYLKLRKFRNLVDQIPLQILSLFHLWRLPAGLHFLKLGEEGFLPTGFAHNAGYGDVVVGIAASAFVFWRPARLGYLSFHWVSMVDFILAVGTGLTFTIRGVPLMANIQTFPVALIPSFGVGVTGALSLMTIHRLLRSTEIDLGVKT